jgi:hypothetical protein
MSKKVIIITAGTEVTLPADWNPNSNTIEVIGGGGGAQATGNAAGSGGNGGISGFINYVALNGNVVTGNAGPGGGGGGGGTSNGGGSGVNPPGTGGTGGQGAIFITYYTGAVSSNTNFLSFF